MALCVVPEGLAAAGAPGAEELGRSEVGLGGSGATYSAGDAAAPASYGAWA